MDKRHWLDTTCEEYEYARHATSARQLSAQLSGDADRSTSVLIFVLGLTFPATPVSK